MLADRGDTFHVSSHPRLDDIWIAPMVIARSRDHDIRIPDAQLLQIHKHARRRIDAHHRHHGAVDLPALERRRHLSRPAHLADLNRALEVVSAQQNAGQVVGHRAEARDAEGFAAQFLHPGDLRLNPATIIGTIDQAHHRHQRRAGEHRRGHGIGRRQTGLHVPAQKRLHHDRSGGNKYQLRIDAVFVERADLLRHPQSDSRRSDRGVAGSQFLQLRRSSAVRGKQQQERRYEDANKSFT